MGDSNLAILRWSKMPQIQILYLRKKLYLYGNGHVEFFTNVHNHASLHSVNERSSKGIRDLLDL